MSAFATNGLKTIRQNEKDISINNDCYSSGCDVVMC